MIPVNTHVVGRSRNCSEPVARLRDSGGSGHSVAQLLCGLGDQLCLWPEDDVLARISSKCRCAKRERERDACTSNRQAAQATSSAYCFHGLTVMRLRILCKLIRRRFRTRIRHFQLSRPEAKVQSVQRKCSKRRLLRRAFASSLRLPPAAARLS
jgi:Zn ribbon nucleic-acid-binding protein